MTFKIGDVVQLSGEELTDATGEIIAVESDDVFTKEYEQVLAEKVDPLDCDAPAWEQRDEKGSAAAPPEYRAYHAVQDLEDVQAADCLLTITEEPRSGGRGGRHVEFGVALALNKRLLVVGHRENVFHHHPQVEFYSSIEDACQALLAR